MKIKLGNYKNRLEANYLDNKISYLEKKNEISVDSYKKDYKEIIKAIN